MGFFDKIKAGLTKTREALSDTLGSVFSGFSEIDDDFYDELEESLILADLGVDTAVKAAAGAVVATTIGGPGIVVAGVAVGAGMLVNYGLDKASEWIFGNEEGWVENVSDTLIDTAHAVGDMMHDASEKVKNMLGNGISSVGKCLMTLWA